MAKGLQQSSKRKQKLYDKYLKNELNKLKNINTNKSLFEAPKEESRKLYYSKLTEKDKKNMEYYEWNIETKNKTRNLPQRIVIGEKEMFEKKIFT